MSELKRIREWRDRWASVGEGERSSAFGDPNSWHDVDVLLREVDRLRERIGEKDRERREAEERALDAERRLTGTRAKLADADAAVSVLRKMFEDEWHRGGYFDIDGGVVDLHLDDLTDEERAVLRRLRADIQRHPTDERT